MANYFTLTLDTTGPANPSIQINNNATYATQQLADLSINTDDPNTTGYQMKIWGDVDTGHNSDIQATQSESSWISYRTAQQVRLSNGDGQKAIYIIIRD